MVFQKNRPKEGISLIRQAVKNGNDARKSISAGAAIQLPQSTSPDDHRACSEPDLPDPYPVAQSSTAIVAANNHILRSTNSHSKATPSVSEKLNRRLSTFIMTSQEISIPAYGSLNTEFLSGTPIFYKATLAIQSRHNRFLTFDEISVSASSKTASLSTQFVIINADNTGDDGNVRYGQAVSLVIDHKKSLGSQHFGRGPMRRLCPVLIKCPKGILQKAHHIGRWILMNRNNPIESLGKNCLHGDKITLEQEWLFLSSSSLNEVTLYKTKNTIADLKIDKFNSEFNYGNFMAVEDCSWKIQLISQKGMDTTDGREFTELITKANTQLLKSIESRNKANKELFGQLAGKINDKIESNKINNLIKHKLDDMAEYDHLMKLYQNNSLNDFISPQSLYNTKKESYFKNNNFIDMYNKNEYDKKNENLNVTIGKNEEIDFMMSPVSIKSPKSNLKISFDFLNFDNLDIKNNFFSPNSTFRSKIKNKNVSYNNTFNTNADHHTYPIISEKIKDNYWKIAQKLLVKSDAWSVLDTAMKKYYNGPNMILQIKSAIIIQRFVRFYCKFLGIIKDRMKETDLVTINYLSSCKEDWKEKFKMELEIKKLLELNRKKYLLSLSNEADALMRSDAKNSFACRLTSNIMNHDRQRSNSGGNDDKNCTIKFKDPGFAIGKIEGGSEGSEEERGGKGFKSGEKDCDEQTTDGNDNNNDNNSINDNNNDHNIIGNDHDNIDGTKYLDNDNSNSYNGNNSKLDELNAPSVSSSRQDFMLRMCNSDRSQSRTETNSHPGSTFQVESSRLLLGESGYYEKAKEMTRDFEKEEKRSEINRSGGENEREGATKREERGREREREKENQDRYDMKDDVSKPISRNISYASTHFQTNLTEFHTEEKSKNPVKINDVFNSQFPFFPESHRRPKTSTGLRDVVKGNDFRNIQYHESSWNMRFEIDCSKHNRDRDEYREDMNNFTEYRIRPKTALPRVQQKKQEKEETFLRKYHHDRYIEERKITFLGKGRENENKETLIRQNEIKFEKRLKKMKEKEIMKKKIISKLCVSKENPGGLPFDVFEEMHGKVSIKTGFNYLLNVSRNRSIITDNNFRF